MMRAILFISRLPPKVPLKAWAHSMDMPNVPQASPAFINSNYLLNMNSVLSYVWNAFMKFIVDEVINCHFHYLIRNC